MLAADVRMQAATVAAAAAAAAMLLLLSWTCCWLTNDADVIVVD